MYVACLRQTEHTSVLKILKRYLVQQRSEHVITRRRVSLPWKVQLGPLLQRVIYGKQNEFLRLGGI